MDDIRLRNVETIVSRIESSVDQIKASDVITESRMRQLESTVYGHKIGTRIVAGVEEELHDALPVIKQVKALIRVVNILIVGLIPTLGGLVLLLVERLNTAGM